MTNKVLPKTALISVSNKSGVVTFAKLLQKSGVKSRARCPLTR